MPRPPLRAALWAAFVILSLLIAPTASARVDVWPTTIEPEAAALPEAEAKSEPLELTDPAPYGRLTDDFGPRWGRMHTGIDIGILRKLGVVAAEDGLVLKTGYVPGFSGYGQVVLIGHRNGFRTLYGHLSTIRVRARQRVARGEWIGNAGCTGSCTGTHLHFEVHKRGTPVDPQRFLAKSR